MCLASCWRVDVDQGEVRVHNDMFFSGQWKWRRGHGRVLNIGVCWSSTQALKLISIQQPTKRKLILHIRDDSLSNGSHGGGLEEFIKGEFVKKKCQRF